MDFSLVSNTYEIKKFPKFDSLFMVFLTSLHFTSFLLFLTCKIQIQIFDFSFGLWLATGRRDFSTHLSASTTYLHNLLKPPGSMHYLTRGPRILLDLGRTHVLARFVLFHFSSFVYILALSNQPSLQLTLGTLNWCIRLQRSWWLYTSLSLSTGTDAWVCLADFSRK